MKILAIETSCDETSIALIEKVGDGKYKIWAHETISQINMHREFGGVYPTLSRREHEKNLVPLLHKVLSDSKLLKLKDQEPQVRDEAYILEKLGNDIELLERYPDLKENVFDFFGKYELAENIDYIAVTNGPGLPPALWVGVNFAKVISILFGNEDISLPIYPINHMEGHIVGAVADRVEDIVDISPINYPAVCLLISGGHTEIVLSSESGKYEKIGETQDDAVGEAYDKVARLLGLPYPGGPEISKLASLGREEKVQSLDFPRPMMHTKDLNFSFSGLKTHILYFTQKLQDISDQIKIEIATEFEEAVKDVLIYKTRKALEETIARSLVVGGGVASNLYLKDNFEKLTKDLQVDLYYSARELATDNALMIALTCANQIENEVQPKKEFGAVGSKNYEW
jgi:N6-L-threonylcarbamoyladenine synthase